MKEYRIQNTGDRGKSRIKIANIFCGRSAMRQKNSGGVFITFLGLIGILIFVAGLSIVLASHSQLGVLAGGVVSVIIGGLIVFEVWKSQKK